MVVALLALTAISDATLITTFRSKHMLMMLQNAQSLHVEGPDTVFMVRSEKRIHSDGYRCRAAA
ncbi:hypothetical protein D3Y57_02830 (plasmid) [Sphingomonas paeninsulae]|uniref:Uncharacterized protein n=1 Tax=Sphingomonas paeninsulae TaxID=2319844 RepID=A0A494T6H6_SPHPE|nr:hypothetical protein D3Y57_02830 [Sphingomonas paeninsulae]